VIERQLSVAHICLSNVAKWAELGPMTFPEPAIRLEYCQFSQSTGDPSQIGVDPMETVVNSC
jgi:hypothetical protein